MKNHSLNSGSGDHYGPKNGYKSYATFLEEKGAIGTDELLREWFATISGAEVMRTDRSDKRPSSLEKITQTSVEMGNITVVKLAQDEVRHRIASISNGRIPSDEELETLVDFVQKNGIVMVEWKE